MQSKHAYLISAGLEAHAQECLPATGGGRTTQLCASGTYGLGYPTLTKDEAGKKRQSWADALGRLIEADEPDSSGSLTLGTCYKYDVLGNLIQVDQGTQTRSFVYDALSRRSSETTPEGGTTRYFYTTPGGALCSGNPNALCRLTDARSITTTSTYDAENRLTAKSYSNGDPTVSYFYDQTSYNGLTITNGKTRRTGMSDGSGQVAWSYNAEGHVLTEKRTIGTVTKTISYIYNLNGSIARTTYPSGYQVWYDYSTAGRLTTARNGLTYFGSGATYAPSGGLSGLLLGWVSSGFAGITTTYTYNNRLQPLNVKATHTNGTVTLLDLTYSFVQAGAKNNGTPVSITNNVVNGRTQNFTYDELNRLKTAYSTANSGADCWGQSFTYDRYSNLSNVSVTKCSAPTLSLSINGNNQIANSGFTYDSAGNLTSTGSANYTYNADELMSSIGGGSVTYTYDGDGRRAKKSNGKLYWYSVTGDVLAESDSSGTITSEYIYFNRRRIARRDPASGNVYYYLTDHIGSARVVTNSSGGVAEQSDFYPFGTERVLTDSLDNNYKFAGMERDTESALDHTLYRQYASNLARWLSPDPADGSPANPQSWNRYPYVLNDPLTLVDPQGATPQYDPYLVGCFPDPFFVMNFGCGWDRDEDPCPPGYEPIYGNPRSDRRGGPAIETAQSALDYANIALGPYADFLSYQAGEYGIDVTFGEELSELVRNGLIAIPIAIPVIIDVLGPVIIRGLQIATISILAYIFEQIHIIDVDCDLWGGNIPTMNEPKKECWYICDDGGSFKAVIPRQDACPERIVKHVIVFVP